MRPLTSPRERPLHRKTSADRTAWRDAGVVWPGGAPWTTAYTGGGANLWAPDISYRDGRYLLYYSASSFASQGSARTCCSTSTTDSGAARLGINPLGWDSAGRPFAY
ncbi:family 43 glycosylhydrolase [Catellatospora methionotrophica]|uniref:family 43 glycosylhydrolase n=1 Tax=Catellatospora methionotrophica TaxID=121620 RepID=UPI0033FB3A78